MLTFRTSPEQRLISKSRRDLLLELGLCINGPTIGHVSKRGRIHGPATSGGRCANCCALHKEARATAPTVRQIVEAHQHLSLDAREDREALIEALEQRRKRPTARG